MNALTASAIELPWKRTRLRVPREDGAFFAQPELRRSLEFAQKNSELLTNSSAQIVGQPLAEVRSAARIELLIAANDYTSVLRKRRQPDHQITPLFGTSGIEAGATFSSPLNPLIIATGHQPEPFHPGVWIKHLAVSELARRHATIGLNLIVDNDTLNKSSVRVPVGTREALSIESVPFDDFESTQPWEEVSIKNRELFMSFSDRVTAAMRPWGVQPHLASIWPIAVEHSLISDNLAECLSAARVQAEVDLGYGNHELAMSRLCETTAFRTFALHLLCHADQLRATYNQIVAEYRVVNRIRNASHPVPDLQLIDGWCEVPLWIWRVAGRARGRVFVRHQHGRLWLADAPSDSRLLIELGSLASSLDDNIARLTELSAHGWKLRTRALTTTCFARLLLCDIFVHGIGGAKYDEITDRLMTRFFGVTAPSFVTLSATAWLRFAEPYSSTATGVRELQYQLRDTQQNPQRHVIDRPTEPLTALLAEKANLVREQQSVEQLMQTVGRRPRHDDSGYQRFRRLREINRQLAQCTLQEQARLQQDIVRQQHEVAANLVIQSREFAAWLYPSDRIHRMSTDLARIV